MAQYLSNELDSFVTGGLYPGGKGRIVTLKYVTWDYNGKQPPDSQVAVYCLFRPEDGSNDGKDVEVYWSVGAAKEMQPSPNGGHLIPTGTKAGIGESCNWHQVLKAFVDQCGLPKGVLDGDKGITILENTEAVLSRVPQKQRDNLPGVAEGGPGDKARARDILVPTRAKSHSRRRQHHCQFHQTFRRVQSHHGTKGNTNTATADSTDSGEVNATSVLTAVLESEGGVIEVSGIAKAAMNIMVNVDKTTRMSILKEIKANLETIVGENGWTLEGGTLTM
jgi:hypothetical protein